MVGQEELLGDRASMLTSKLEGLVVDWGDLQDMKVGDRYTAVLKRG